MLIAARRAVKVFMIDAYCTHRDAPQGHNGTSYAVRDKQHIEGDSIIVRSTAGAMKWARWQVQ